MNDSRFYKSIDNFPLELWSLILSHIKTPRIRINKEIVKYQTVALLLDDSDFGEKWRKRFIKYLFDHQGKVFFNPFEQKKITSNEFLKRDKINAKLRLKWIEGFILYDQEFDVLAESIVFVDICLNTPALINPVISVISSLFVKYNLPIEHFFDAVEKLGKNDKMIIKERQELGKGLENSLKKMDWFYLKQGIQKLFIIFKKEWWILIPYIQKGVRQAIGRMPFSEFLNELKDLKCVLSQNTPLLFKKAIRQGLAQAIDGLDIDSCSQVMDEITQWVKVKDPHVREAAAHVIRLIISKFKQRLLIRRGIGLLVALSYEPNIHVKKQVIRGLSHALKFLESNELERLIDLCHEENKGLKKVTQKWISKGVSLFKENEIVEKFWILNKLENDSDNKCRRALAVGLSVALKDLNVSINFKGIEILKNLLWDKNNEVSQATVQGLVYVFNELDNETFVRLKKVCQQMRWFNTSSLVFEGLLGSLEQLKSSRGMELLKLSFQKNCDLCKIIGQFESTQRIKVLKFFEGIYNDDSLLVRKNTARVLSYFIEHLDTKGLKALNNLSMNKEVFVRLNIARLLSLNSIANMKEDLMPLGLNIFVYLSKDKSFDVKRAIADTLSGQILNVEPNLFSKGLEILIRLSGDENSSVRKKALVGLRNVMGCLDFTSLSGLLEIFKSSCLETNVENQNEAIMGRCELIGFYRGDLFSKELDFIDSIFQNQTEAIRMNFLYGINRMVEHMAPSDLTKVIKKIEPVCHVDSSPLKRLAGSVLSTIISHFDCDGLSENQHFLSELSQSENKIIRKEVANGLSKISRNISFKEFKPVVSILKNLLSDKSLDVRQEALKGLIPYLDHLSAQEAVNVLMDMDKLSRINSLFAYDLISYKWSNENYRNRVLKNSHSSASLNTSTSVGVSGKPPIQIQGILNKFKKMTIN